MTTLTYDLYVRATPDDLWGALTDPAMVPRWRFGMSFTTDWRPGAALTSHSPDGVGTVRESAPGRRLVYDWAQPDQPQSNGGRPSVVEFMLAPLGGVTRLTVTHSDLDPDGTLLKAVAPGRPMILSSLKSLLETGEPLAFGA